MGDLATAHNCSGLGIWVATLRGAFSVTELIVVRVVVSRNWQTVAGRMMLRFVQIADIAAFEARKALANPITRPHLPERKSLARLKEAGRVWSISFLDEPVLKAIYEMKREELGLPNNAKEVAEKLDQLRPDGWQYRPKNQDDPK